MITERMPNNDYHDAPGVSKSGLSLIMRSPAHFMFQEKRASSRAFVIGSATHAAILEPDLFASEYMLLREVTDRRASAYKQAVAVHGEDFVLTGTEADYVAGMQESVRSHPGALEILSAPGRAELSVSTTDPETGVIVRIRPDWVTHDGRMLDLKTTQDARYEAFSRSVVNYNYHMQQAFYQDVWFWETGERLPFEFLVVEKAMPHAVMMYRLDEEAIREGRRMYREALNTYARCLESNHWPAYGTETEYLSLPSWAVDADVETEELNDE